MTSKNNLPFRASRTNPTHNVILNAVKNLVLRNQFPLHLMNEILRHSEWAGNPFRPTQDDISWVMSFRAKAQAFCAWAGILAVL